ncbi:MAG: hypothetical protein ACTSW4_02105 [Candidatus Ranarchaeia archaeon]
MPIHPPKIDVPSSLTPSVDLIRDNLEIVISRMRDKPVVNVRLVGLQQVDHLTVVRGRFKEDFAYEKGFIAVVSVSADKELEIKDIVIVPGFEE